ncbi:hypothetical protein GCM10027515_26780 [Schumannella luteola]|uniref:Flp pilus assembly protein CpaB n=1 Tax=Schumannella luteola TaxID=472059 RepID=A0A852YQM1_9MICO|nr:hypothetical protein [Schumannella luteola]NYG99525.1 Flp pilus assembly protein CpaB [Schumannella luteola]TPX03846.1 hypothetical protein FJ656_15035 [Schumannella luteola]
MRRRPLVLAALLLSLMLAIGAIAVAIGPRLEAPPTPAPLDPAESAREHERVLLEARDAIRDYREISDRVGQAGWIEVEPLRDAVSSAQFDRESREAETRRAGGWVQRGATEADAVRIEASERQDGRIVRVLATACVDSGAARVQRLSDGALDAVTHPSRQRMRFELQRYRERGGLRVASVEVVGESGADGADSDSGGVAAGC